MKADLWILIPIMILRPCHKRNYSLPTRTQKSTLTCPHVPLVKLKIDIKARWRGQKFIWLRENYLYYGFYYANYW